LRIRVLSSWDSLSTEDILELRDELIFFSTEDTFLFDAVLPPLLFALRLLVVVLSSVDDVSCWLSFELSGDLVTLLGFLSVFGVILVLLFPILTRRLDENIVHNSGLNFKTWRELVKTKFLCGGWGVLQ
jgi:hypothetical protein